MEMPKNPRIMKSGIATKCMTSFSCNIYLADRDPVSEDTKQWLDSTTDWRLTKQKATQTRERWKMNGIFAPCTIWISLTWHSQFIQYIASTNTMNEWIVGLKSHHSLRGLVYPQWKRCETSFNQWAAPRARRQRSSNEENLLLLVSNSIVVFQWCLGNFNVTLRHAPEWVERSIVEPVIN